MTGGQYFQIAIILVYLIVLIIVGKKAGGTVSSDTDFHLAGRQMSWLIIAAGLVGTNFSGAVITSVTSFGYKYGLGSLWYEGCTIIGFLICAFCYARRVRLSGAFTISELFELKYDYAVRLIAGFFITLGGLSAAAAQFSAVGLIVNTVFGIPKIWGILIAWVIVLFYMVMGGFWATNLTNLPQLIFGFIGFPGLAIWALFHFGDVNVAALADIQSATGESYWSLFSAPIALVLTWVLQWMWMNEWGSQWYFQRASAARDVKHAKIGFWSSACFLTLGVLIPGLILGIYAKAAYPELASSEVALSTIIAASPIILGGIATAGVFAAAMSTVDGCSMGAITVIVRDFYQRLINKNATPEQSTRVSRWVTAVVLIAILLFATTLSSVWAGLSFIFVFTTGMFGPLVAALFWKKACKEGALISMVVAGCVSMYWTFIGGGARFNSAWWAIWLSLSLMTIISLIVNKTGPWWGKGKKEAANAAVKAEIVEFLSNRTATMSDLIDRTEAGAMNIKRVISELIAEKKLVEVEYMTYCLAENCDPEKDVFTKDSGAGKDWIMILASVVSIVLFIYIWKITA